MQDQQTWHQAADAAKAAYRALPADIRKQLDEALDEIMAIKQSLVDQVVNAGSRSICQSCGGKCCLYGKYHVSVLDYLAYVRYSVEALVPDFTNSPFCPYSDASGCLMSSRYRPMTCVVFNCDQIENLMGTAEQNILQQNETALRTAITRACRISGMPADRALLLSTPP